MTSNIDLERQQALIKIFLFIDVEERLKLREVCKEWRDAVDASWAEIRSLRILDPLLTNEDDAPSPDEIEYESDPESVGIEQALSGTNEIIRIRTSDQVLIEEVFKRCGKYITGLLEEFRKMKNFSTLSLAIKYCPNIEKMCLSVRNNADDEHAKKLLSITEKLENLGLRMEFTDMKKCFGAIPTQCLEQLVLLCECEGPSTAMLNGQKSIIGKSLPALELLLVNYFDDGLLKLIGRKITLKILDLHFLYAEGVTHKGINHLLNLKNLTRITFDSKLVKSDCHPLPVTDDFLSKLADYLPLLEMINIQAPGDVTDEGFKSLASLKKLELLSITECEGITDKYLPLFSGLQGLDLMACTIRDKGVIGLLKKAELLEVLNLSHTKITHRALKAAVTAVKKRTNGMPLNMCIVGTYSRPGDLSVTCPLLKLGF